MPYSSGSLKSKIKEQARLCSFQNLLVESPFLTHVVSGVPWIINGSPILTLHLHMTLCPVCTFLSLIMTLSLGLGPILNHYDLLLISSLTASAKTLIPNKFTFWGSKWTWIWGEHYSVPLESIIRPPKFTSTPHVKYIHLNPPFHKVLTHSSTNWKSKSTSNIINSESPKSHHLILRHWYGPSWGKIPTYRPGETKKQVISFQNTVAEQAWDRHSHWEELEGKE